MTNWKDTVMDEIDIRATLGEAHEYWKSPKNETASGCTIKVLADVQQDFLIKAQAELSFKAGYKYALEGAVMSGAYESIKKIGIKEVVELALQAIADEPEFPSDMPDELWIELNGNRHNTLLAMRNSVRLTKKGITERLEAQLKTWGVK